MKPSAFVTLGLALAMAGCSGSSNTANQAPSQDTNAAAPAAPAEASAPAGQAASAALPVYPGATKSTLMGTMNQTKCGHKLSMTTYTTPDDAKTVNGWYASRISGGIQLDPSKALKKLPVVSSSEIFTPDGSAVVGITEPSVAGMGSKLGTVYISLGTYDPPLGVDEMKTIQAIMADDPATKRAGIAAMKAKCGPESVKAYE